MFIGKLNRTFGIIDRNTMDDFTIFLQKIRSYRKLNKVKDTFFKHPIHYHVNIDNHVP